MFSLKEIAKVTKGKLIAANKDAIVKGVSTDTRTISRGEIFIALKGERFNGHKFIKDAFKKSAAAVIASDKNIKISKGPIIEVKNTRKALGAIASAYRRRFKLPIVAITGSNGKTTVKDMIAHILSKKYKIAKTPGTENNLIGISFSMLNIKNEECAVIEVGTNAQGEINENAKILRPRVGIIINIGPAHLQGLKNLKNILKEKSKLFNYIEKGGYAIINKDDVLLSSLKTKNKHLTFGILNKKCDYRASKVVELDSGIEFILNKYHKFTLPVFGIHNVYNALAAIAACRTLGLDIKTCQQALSRFKPPNMRFNIRKQNGMNIINDAYNSNPLSMRAAMSTLRSLKTKGRRIVAAADMLELGNKSQRLHYKTGQMIAESGVDILITVGDLSKHMAKGARDSGMLDGNVMDFKKRKNAAACLNKLCRRGDTVLVKGSRRMKMEELIKCFTTSYIR